MHVCVHVHVCPRLRFRCHLSSAFPPQPSDIHFTTFRFFFPKHNWNTPLSYEESLMPPTAGGMEPRFLSMVDLSRCPFTSVRESTGGTRQLMGPKSRWPS